MSGRSFKFISVLPAPQVHRCNTGQPGRGCASSEFVSQLNNSKFREPESFFNGMQANLPDICLGRRHYLIVLGNKENMSFALEGNTTSVFQGYSSINNYKKIARSSVLKMCEMQVIHGKFS